MPDLTAPMKLCINCKFYVAGNSVSEDSCRHEKAQRALGRTSYDGVRARVTPPSPTHYGCDAMRAGICGENARLFEGVTYAQPDA